MYTLVALYDLFLNFGKHPLIYMSEKVFQNIKVKFSKNN